MTKFEIRRTSQFKKDYKRAAKRGHDMQKLDDAIELLAESGELPPEYKDHNLVGNWVGFRECHIAPDWLLVYEIENNILVLTLTATGSHSDLFS